MRTRIRTLPLLLIPAGAFGCSSLPKTLPGPPPKITTVTSVGDQPRPVVSGTPGNSVAADVDYVEERRVTGDRLSGRVVDARGEPVPGANVRLAIGSASAGRTTSVNTDDAGRFTIHGLRPGTDYTVIAETEDEQGRVATGRVRAQALEKGVEIALARPSRSGRGGGITPVSNPKRVDAEYEDDGAGRVNEEDLPPAREAEDLEFSQQRTDRLATDETPTRAIGKGWRRGGKGATADEEAAPKTDNSPIPTPESVTPLEDDGPNPLPPAKEPAPAAAVMNSQEPFEAQAPAHETASAAPAPAMAHVANSPSPSDEPFTAQPEPPRTAPTLAELSPAAPSSPAAAVEASQPGSPAPAPAQPPASEANAPQPAPAQPALTEPPKDVPVDPKPADGAPPANDVTPEVQPTPAQQPPTAPPAGVAPAPAPEAKAAETPVPSRDNPLDSLEPKPADSAQDSTQPAASAAPADAAPAPSEPAPNTQAAASPAKKQTWAELTQVSRPAVAATLPPKPVAPTRPRLIDRILPKPAAASPAPAALASCDYDTRTHRLVDFQLPDIDGKPVHFKDLDADFILVDFWGSWCGPCLGAIPHLVELQSQHSPSRLKVIGIAYEDAQLREAAKSAGDAAKRLGINYPVLLGGADGKTCPVQTALHIQAYPTMILLDRNGRILWREQGATAMSLARLDRVIASTIKPDVVRR